MKPQGLLSLPDAAHYLGLTPRGLKSMVAARSVPFERLSPRRLRFKREDLEEFVRRKRIRAAWEG